MKIFAVGMNYIQHNKELDGTLYKPEEPVIFTKADSALLKDSKPFFLPDELGRIDYETELVVRICRLGKSIPQRFAHRYYDAVTVGIDFTARDLQNRLRAEGFVQGLRRLGCNRRMGEHREVSRHTGNTFPPRHQRQHRSGRLLERHALQGRRDNSLHKSMVHAEDRRHPLYGHSGRSGPRSY